VEKIEVNGEILKKNSSRRSMIRVQGVEVVG
jgi:hypothetical protein